MLVDMIFKEMKDDYKRYGEVLQVEYFDDWISETRTIFKVEGDKLLVNIKNDIEEFEIVFTMDINFIIHSPLEECIKEFNECYYYAPNVYEDYL